MNLRHFILSFFIVIFLLSGCGGGGGGSSFVSDPDVRIEEIPVYFEIEGKIWPDALAGTSRAPGRAADAGAYNQYSLFIFDGAAGFVETGEILVSGSSYRALFQIGLKNASPFIELREKTTGKTILKNFVGKLPTLAELPSETRKIKLKGIDLDHVSTARALLIAEKKVIPAISIVSVDTEEVRKGEGVVEVDVAGRKTQFEASVDTNFLGGAESVKIMSDVVRTVVFTLGNEGAPRDLKDSIKTGSAAEIIASFQSIVTKSGDEYRKVLAANDLPESVSFFGAVVGDSKADPGVVVTLITDRPADSSPPFVSSFSLSLEDGRAYSLKFKTSEKLYRPPKVKIAGRQAEVFEIVPGDYYATALYEGADANPVPFEIDDLSDLAGNRAGAFAAKIKVKTPTPVTRVAAPAILPPGGAFDGSVEVALSCETPGAQIYYTLGGEEPSKNSGRSYFAPFRLSSSAVIKAAAFKPGMPDSPVASAAFEIKKQYLQAAKPVFTPPGGTYPGPLALAITSPTRGSLIRYTTDGSAPSATRGTLYGGPISVSTTLAVKAVCFADGFADSEISAALYEIAPKPVTAAPLISGSQSDGLVTVTISCPDPEAEIYYSIDGSAPAVSSSARYSGPFTVPAGTTVKAMASRPGAAQSTVAAAFFSAPDPSGGPRPKAATPVFNPATGKYKMPLTVAITTSSPGAAIRYTTDGSTPSESAGTFYSGPFAINAATTVRAAAYGADYSVSVAAEAVYYEDTTPVYIPVDTQGPKFTAAYFRDAGLSVSAGDHPRLGPGTWYLAVRADESLKEPPLVTLIAEAAGHGTVEAAMLPGPGGYYFIERTIDGAIVSNGDTPETILISGADQAGNRTAGTEPQNPTAAARIDNVAPPPPQIAEDAIAADTGGCGNSRNRINAALAGNSAALKFVVANRAASSEPGALYIKLYDATGSRTAENSPAAVAAGADFNGIGGFSAGALDAFAEGAVRVEARVRDAAGNFSAPAFVELAGCLDRTAPGASALSFSAPLAAVPRYARPDVSAVLKFTPSEALKEAPEISAAGRPAVPALSEGIYEAVWALDASIEEGAVPFEIRCLDAAGNPAVFNYTTDSTAVTFDKTPPAVPEGTLVFPAGGERLRGGAGTAVTWNASAVSDNFGLPSSPVSISLSTDSGISWTPLAAGELNDGSFSWIPPSVNADNALIKLSFTDLASNTSEITSGATFAIDSQLPAPLSASPAADNSYLDVVFNEGVYGPGGSAPTAASFAAVYEQNGGITASVSILSARRTDETILAGGETAVRLFVSLSAVPSGVEKIKTGPSGAAALFDAAGNAMHGAAYSPAAAFNDLRPPEIASLSISPDYDHIDIAFSEGVYGSDGTPLQLEGLAAIFENNSGKIDSVTVTSLKKSDGSVLTGGETIVRAFITLAGTPTGVESIAFKPASGSSVFDARGNAMPAAYVSAATYFIDSEAPPAPFDIVITPSEGTVVPNTLNSTNTNLVVTARITAGTATGGKAVLYIDGRATATDETILAGDTMAAFDPACTTNGALAALVPSGGEVAVRIIDAAGNSTLSVDGNPVLTIDYSRPAADITYSAPSPYKAGADITVTAAFDQPLAPAAVVNFSTEGASTMAPAAMTKIDDTHFTYSYEAGAGDGTVSVVLSGASDANGNPVVQTPSSGGDFVIDNTPPEASITYSPEGPVKTGTVLTITAELSEPPAAAPLPSIAIAGANTRTPVAMTKIDDLHYQYLHTTAAGNGTASVTLSAAADAAGNPIVSTPETGAFFIVDNTVPAASVQYSVNGVQLAAPRVKKNAQLLITAVFAEPIDEAYPPKITGSSPETFSAITMTRVEPNVYTYLRTIATASSGTVSVTFSNARDLAGNLVASAPVSGAQFYVDNVIPNAYLTYSPAGPYPAGKNFTIFATFSEPVVASPAPAISISGAQTLDPFEMTVIDPTHYRLDLTAGDGNGPATVAFTAGMDEATNAIKAAPVSGAVFSLDNTPLLITFAALASDNSYIDIGFSEGVFGSGDGQSPAGDANFELSFNANGGDATDAEITSVTTQSGDALQGGETTVRVRLAITGSPSGVETITITPSATSPLYDGAALPIAAGLTTGAKPLNDSARPTLSAAYSISPARYKAGTAVTVTATFSEAVSAAPAPSITISGANSVSGAAMTMLSSTQYRYIHTVGAGNGEAFVSVAAKAQSSGLDFISTPSAGSSFTVDNSPPTFSISGRQVNEAGDVIEIAFNEEMTAAGLTTKTNWTLYHADNNAGLNQAVITVTNASVTYDALSRTLTFTLNESIDNAFIPPGKFIGALANATNIKDAAGNSSGALYIYSDQATPTEAQPPTFTVAGTSRDNLGDLIVLTFSDSMNNTLNAITTKTNWTFAWADDALGTNLTAIPITNATLAYSISAKTLTVTLHEGTDKAYIPANKFVRATPHPVNIKDVAGNAIGDFSAFSASVPPETVRPEVTTVTASSVSGSGDIIYVNFNDHMNQTAGLLNDKAKWSFKYADDAAGTNATPFVVTNASLALSFSTSYKRIYLTLNETTDKAYIPPGKFILVEPLSEVPTDFAGNALLTTARTTAAAVATETTAPTITTVTGYSVNAANDYIRIVFSEPMGNDLWPLTDKTLWTLEISDNASGLNSVPVALDNAVLSYVTASRYLQITLNEAIDGAFLPGGKYVKATLVDPSRARDLVGNQCATVSKYSAAVTKETTRPLISAVALLNGDGNIGDGDAVRLTFSEPVAPASIHPDLSRGGSVTISGDVTGQLTWQAGTKIITIANICYFTIVKPVNFANARASSSQTSLSLDGTGKILTVTMLDGVTTETVSAFASSTAITVPTASTTVTDLVGNLLNTSTTKVIPAGQKF